jgi:hypothetical protein
MEIETVYGIGGFCENCEKSHNHPLNNIVKIIEHPELDTEE